MLNKKRHMGSPSGLGSLKFGVKSSGSLSFDSIFAGRGFTNMWTAENSESSGGTTTVFDYAGEHDLDNASGGFNEPVKTASDPLFGGLDSLAFVQANNTGVLKSVADWRIGDTQGQITWLAEPVPTKTTLGLVAADNGVANQYWGNVNLGGANFGRFQTPSSNNRINNAEGTVTLQLPKYICTVASDGSRYYLVVNGIVQEYNVNGTDNGAWVSTVGTTDNITIGVLRRNSLTYASMQWCMSGYHSTFQGVSEVVAMHQDIMTLAGMEIELAMSQLNQIGGGIINGWNYDYLSEISTTTYAYDLKGQYAMENPAATNQPSLQSTHLEFRTDDYIYNTVSDYLIANTSSCIHMYFDFQKNINAAFASSNGAASTDNVRFGISSVDRAEIIEVPSPSGLFRTNTGFVTLGYGVLSIFNTGSEIKIQINGVNEPINVDQIGNQWFDDFINRTNISIGAIIRSVPLYRDLDWKSTIITNYVDDATVSQEALKILNSGL